MKFLLALAVLILMPLTASADEVFPEKTSKTGVATIAKLASLGDFTGTSTLYRVEDKKTGNIIYVLTPTNPSLPNQIEVVPAWFINK